MKVALDGSKAMLVHQIAEKPSFDQILVAQADDALSNLTSFKLTRGEPWPVKQKNSDPIKPIYLETQDFQ